MKVNVGLATVTLVAVLMWGDLLAAGGADAKSVRVTADATQHRVDITLDGAPFTSYLWPDTLMKPVLYPLIAPDGTTLTRGYPLTQVAGERVDHPHHAGLWFNYSNVNGFDFWNNSTAIAADKRDKMGTIHDERIVATKSGKDRGELDTESTWTTGAGQDIIRQNTRYIFSRNKEGRSIDLVVTLHALDTVVFKDDKDGMLGIRVAQFLESPTEKGGVFVDTNGVQTKVTGGASPLASGVYLTSEGKQGDAAWGTRGRWCLLTGKHYGNVETIAVLDHPLNPGYPTYWHARGYGLFAVNPLGVASFDPKAAPMNFTLRKGESATFRYRVLLMSHATTAGVMDAEQAAFASEYK